MYTYHDPHIGTQLNYTNDPNFRGLVKFLSDYDAPENDNMSTIFQYAKEDKFFEDMDEERFVADVVNFIDGNDDITVQTAYHGDNDCMVLWIEHEEFSKQLHDSFEPNDIFDYTMTPKTLSHVATITKQYHFIIRQSNMSAETKSILLEYSGLIFINKSS